MKNKIVGILGGIGPETTGRFYLRLISALQKNGLIGSNTDFPQIIINSIPAKELIHAKIIDRDLELYMKGLKELDRFGVDFIVMACNTIHLFHERLQSEIKTPILDIRKALREFLMRKKVRSVAVLGTPMTIKQGLYRFNDFEYFDLTKNNIKLITDAVFNFNKGFKKEQQKKIIENIAKTCLDKGAEIIVLGCTELSLMLENIDIPKIDTMDILLAATIKNICTS